MNLENLELNKKYKYKTFCKVLEIEQKKNTNSKKAQLKELQQHMNIIKDGTWYTVTEIYQEPKEKVDNRKGNSGKSEGSRNNYKGIYAEYIDDLLLQYLQKEENKLKDTCKIYTTNNKIAEATGIVNHNFRTAFNNQEKFYNTVKKDFNIRTNTYCMWDTIKDIKTKIREIVRLSLNRLQKTEKIEYKPCYLVYVPYTTRIPSKDEMEAIELAEETVMQEMGIDKKEKIDNNKKLSDEFNKKVLGKVQEKYDYIQSIYKGYEITLCEDFEIKSDEDNKDATTKLNKLVINSLQERPQKKYDKTRSEKGDNWFGSRNPNWKRYIYDRLSNKYVEHCYSFIDILCNLNAKNIVNNIKSQKNTKINNKLSIEEREEDINKYSKRFLDMFYDSIELTKEDDIDLPF